MKTRTDRFVKAAFTGVISLCILFLVGSLAGYCYGQEDIDWQALILETQKGSPDPNKMTLVWWLPEQFWIASLAQDPTISEAAAAQFIEVLRPYTMIVAIDGEIGVFGGVTYKTEKEVRSSIRIKDTEGRTYTPLQSFEIDADTKMLIQVMEPILASMLGEMGQNMHFILFRDERGTPIVNAMGKGFFEVVLGEEEFRFRLPLGSLLPPKYDPDTGEKFPGNYNYNPFTGTKLVK